jgi:hypothetical protein
MGQKFLLWVANFRAGFTTLLIRVHLRKSRGQEVFNAKLRLNDFRVEWHRTRF